MTKAKRTEIQIEKHEISVIKLRRKFEKAYCERCGARVSVVEPEKAAKILSIALPDLSDPTMKGIIHTVHRDSDLLCIRSVISKTDS
jgi:hypothetical protein